MPTSKPVSYRREIVAILIVKLILIVAIKLAFFSDAKKPDSEAVSAALISASTPASPSVPARSPRHE